MNNWETAQWAKSVGSLPSFVPQNERSSKPINSKDRTENNFCLGFGFITLQLFQLLISIQINKTERLRFEEVGDKANIMQFVFFWSVKHLYESGGYFY